MNQTFFPVQKSILSATALKNEVVSKYQLPEPVSCKLRHADINGNQIYLVTSQTSQYYLCLFKQQARTLEETEKEIAHLSRLSRQGNLLNNIILTTDGSSFFKVNAPEGERYLAIFKTPQKQQTPPTNENKITAETKIAHLSIPSFPVQESRLAMPALIKDVLSNYDIDSAIEITLVREGISDIYKVKSGSEIYWLKIYKNFVMNGMPANDKQNLQATVDLLIDINKSKDIEVVIPIKAKDGSYILTINAPEGDRYAILYNNAQGDVPLNTFWKRLDSKHFFQCGMAVAHLYNSADKLETEYKRNHLDLEQLIDNSMKYIDPSAFEFPQDYEYLTQISTILKDKINSLLPKTKPEYGICHGDLHPGNVRISDNKFIFFDFDNWNYGWRALDFSQLQRFRPQKGIFKKMQFNKQWKAFMDGFLKVRPFNETENQTVPIFSIIFLIYRTGAIFSMAADNDTVVNDDFAFLHQRVNQIKQQVKKFKIC